MNSPYVGAKRASGDSSEDVYFSVDVETDGPIPGDFSMLAFAIVEAGYHDGRRIVANEAAESQYWELKPLSAAGYEAEAMAVNRLDRRELTETGTEPGIAMQEAFDWVSERSNGRRPVMVASPAAFDWMFMHWYFVHTIGKSPFGYSGCFDVKTALSVRLNRPIARSGRSSIPAWLSGSQRHTHNALDDAREQASVFLNLAEWRGLSYSHGA